MTGKNKQNNNIKIVNAKILCSYVALTYKILYIMYKTSNNHAPAAWWDF